MTEIKMEKIRVLHILDELNTGGAERVVVSYFQNVDRERFQWDFIITQYADENKRGLLEETVEQLGGRIYRVPRKRENYISNIVETAKIIKNGHYDIVHSHLDELSAFYLAAAKKYRVPVRICHSHLAGANRGRGVELVCRLIHPIMVRCTTDKFACGQDAGRALWGERAVESGLVHIMHNAINTEIFRFNTEYRNRKRNELNIEGKTVIGTVGRLSYQKNSLFLIPIFREIKKKNPNAVLVVVGEGEKKSEMTELAENMGVLDSVLFLGGRNDVDEIMMAMDAFLLPSRFEGLPIVMVEAQCSGLNCIVSDRITTEIKINPNVKYISIDEDEAYWASETLALIKNGSFSRDMGYQMIEKHGYEISNEAHNLEEYYMAALRKE